MTKEDFNKCYECYILPLMKLITKNNQSEYRLKEAGESVEDSGAHKDAIYEEYMNQRTFFRALMGKEVGKSADMYTEKDELCRHKVCACMTIAIVKTRPIVVVNHPEDKFTLEKAPRFNEQLALSVGLSMLRMYVLQETDPGEKKRADYFKENVFLLAEPLPRQARADDSPMSILTRSVFHANVTNGLNPVLLSCIYFHLDRYHEAQSKINELEAKLRRYEESEHRESP